MKKTRKHYLKIVEWSAADGCYIGRCPELFLGGVHGKDEAKVYGELCTAVEDVVALIKSKGDKLPPSLAEKEFSGKFVLRVDPDLHRLLAARAMIEGDSLNSYVVKKLQTA